MPRKEGASPEKARYFSNLAQRNISSARLLKDGGCLRVRIIDPDTSLTTWQDIEDRELWRNVSEHTLAQTAGCSVLAEALGLPQASIRRLESAALLHDWDKKFQSTGLRQIDQRLETGEISEQDRGRLKQELFEESERHNEEGLKNAGIPYEIIKLATADGHGSLPRMVEPDCTIEEKNPSLRRLNYI